MASWNIGRLVLERAAPVKPPPGGRWQWRRYRKDRRGLLLTLWTPRALYGLVWLQRYQRDTFSTIASFQAAKGWDTPADPATGKIDPNDGSPNDGQES